jgi:mono/diheme cytochrome c family protein
MLPVLPMLLIGLLAGPAFAQAADDGESLFKSKCAGCHSQKKVLGDVRKLPEAERRAHLEKFLVSHFAPDAAHRKAICDHLTSAAGGN